MRRARRGAMADLLLTRGANPNVHVYASGSPVYSAYRHRQPEMIALFKRTRRRGRRRHRRLVPRNRPRPADARGRNARAAAGRHGLAGTYGGGDLLDYGSCGGDAEIVRMALERIDWPRGDDRWFWMLGRSLETDANGSSHLECFPPGARANRGPHTIGRFGRTMLQ
jgi:hypothetical protein